MSATLEHRSGDRLLFGPFELRPAERLLRREGVPVSLGSRAMDVLLCLLERPGDVVGPDDLRTAVWRGVTVEPTALRVQLSALRKVLAAADPETRYVSNVAGRGYCFVAPVRREAGAAIAASTPDPAVRPILPPAPRRMIGREGLVEALERIVAAEQLVTLVGPGGIGKTTVALALARCLSSVFDGELAFVDLAIHTGDHSVAVAVASALRLPRLGADPVAEVVSLLQSRRLLLILDSCEHVIAGAAALAEAISQAAPGCHIVATSREPLDAVGEQVRRLDALETPPSEAMSFEAVCAYPAAQLFVERVEAAGGLIERRDADALLVADMCRKLDGIPLAIELAAGRVDAFGLETTHTLLDSRLRLSWPGRRTAPPRHITLSATLDWSYDLLSPDEAELLRALSTFVGWFPLDAAQAVAADSIRAQTPQTVASLVAKSLVSVDRGRSPVEYRLLETTRVYARAKLEAAGERRAAAARHAAWTLTDLRAVKDQFPEGLPTQAWVAYFSNRIEDAHAAFDWSLSKDGDRSLTVPLTLAAEPYWSRLYRGEEARRRIEEALALVEARSRDELTLTLWLGSYSAMFDVDRAEAASNRALELAVAFDDWPRQFLARYWLWNTHIGDRPDIQKAREHALLHRELAGQRGELSDQVRAEHMVGVSELIAGNLAAARTSVDHARTLSPTWAPGPGSTLVSLLWLSGMPDTAAAAAQANLDGARATGIIGYEVAALSDGCAALALCLGDLEGASRYADMIDQCVDRGIWFAYRTWSQLLRATVAARAGDTGPGRAFLGRPLPTECGHPRFASALTELASRLGAAGAEDVARDLADRLLQRIERTGERWMWSEVQRVRGELARDPAEAEALFEAALAVAQQQGARAWALRAATSLARRRRSVAEQVLKPLLASFIEGDGTQDIIEARSVLGAWRIGLPTQPAPTRH